MECSGDWNCHGSGADGGVIRKTVMLTDSNGCGDEEDGGSTLEYLSGLKTSVMSSDQENSKDLIKISAK